MTAVASRAWAVAVLVSASVAAWPVSVDAEAQLGEPRKEPAKVQQDVTKEATGALLAVVSGFRNRKGQLLLAVFASDEGFPNQVKQAVFHQAYPIESGTVKVQVADLEPGTYAVAIHHDEDGDFEMDTGFFGIPREGYGASNDAPARFGPPKFRHARFELKAGQRLELPIHVRYF